MYFARASLLLGLLVLWCALALLASVGCAAKLPDLPDPPNGWSPLYISERVPNSVKVCVVNGPIAKAEAPYACVSVGVIRQLARSQRGS